MDTIATHEDEKITQISYAVFSTLFGEPSSRQKEMRELEKTLATYPPHLLARVHTELTEVEDDLANELVLILSGPTNDPVDVDEYIAFSPYVQKVTTLKSVCRMIQSLHNYPQLPPMENYAEAPEHVRAQIVALLHVVDFLMHSYSASLNDNYPIVLGAGIAMLEGDSLIRLVINHPDKAELIATTIISRDIKDVTLLRDIITSDAPSISEGTL